MRLIRWREFHRYHIANRYRFVLEDIQDYFDTSQSTGSQGGIFHGLEVALL